jgi:hypothetical protein
VTRSTLIGSFLEKKLKFELFNFNAKYKDFAIESGDEDVDSGHDHGKQKLPSPPSD